MKAGGYGGGNTITGLVYEGKVDLATFISGQRGYFVIGNYVFYKGKRVAYVLKKYGFYKFLEKKV